MRIVFDKLISFLEADYSDFSCLNLNYASVTVDRVVGKFHSGEDIFRVIHDHLSNNIIQVTEIIVKLFAFTRTFSSCRLKENCLDKRRESLKGLFFPLCFAVYFTVNLIGKRV